MTEKSDGGLLVDARPLSPAATIRRRLVEGLRVAARTVLLDADPGWTGALNIALVKSGVRMGESRRGDRLTF